MMTLPINVFAHPRRNQSYRHLMHCNDSPMGMSAIQAIVCRIGSDQVFVMEASSRAAGNQKQGRKIEECR